MMKKKFLFVIIFLGTFAAFAQKKKEVYDPKKTYTPAQLQEDFSFLRKCLEESHPGLYWYTPKDSINFVFDNFQKSINHDMTEREFRNALFPVLANIRCGHSTLSNSIARQKYLKASITKSIPLDIFSIDNQLFINDNLSKDSTIKKGTEILSVDGMASEELVSKMANSFSSDGYNETHKKITASRHFQTWYPRLFQEKDTFEIVIKDSLQQVRKVRLPAIKAKNFPFKNVKIEKPKTLYSNKKVNTFSLDKENPSIAVLKISAFTPTGYWKLYRKSFKYLEKNKVENLVLDMRGNGGGMIFHPGHLLSYLIDNQENITIYRENKKPSFLEQTDNKGKFLRITEKLFPKIPKRTGVTTVKNDSIYKISIQTKVRKKHHYNGNLYVLVDGRSFSATCVASAFLKKNNRGVFIGQETGGGEKGCNAMIMNNLILPNTKLRYRFPFFRVEHDVKPKVKGRGIIPEIPINYDSKAVLENRDLELEKVSELVKNKGKN